MSRELLNRHRTGFLFLLGAALVATTLSASWVIAQQRVADGRALDSSLKVGDGGYNRTGHRTGGGVQSYRYTPTKNKPLYTTDRQGNMIYNSHNAFNPNSRYTATGYTGNYTTSKSFKRTRTRGQYH